MTKTAAGASPVDCHVRPLVDALRALPDTRPEPEPFEAWRDACGLALAAADELDRLRMALHEIGEEWAGAECGEPVHAQEAYAIGLAKRMYALAVAALRPNVAVEARR